jgi:hypothetical protein
MTFTVFAEDENNDPYIDPDTGDQAVLTGAAAVGQVCKSRIQAQRGEMKYAADQGMPTFSTAFNTFNPQQFEAAARTIILGTPYIIGIQSFSMYTNANTLYYTAVIQTQYGQTTVTGVAAQ